MTVELIDACRAAARLTKALELALADASLSLPQYRLLAFLSGGAERATSLAGWLDVSPPSLTNLVDGAVARGLVARVAVADDRRAVRHEVTAAGLRALAEGDRVVSARLSALVDFLSPSEARRAVEGLELIGKAISGARVRAEERVAVTR